MPNHYLENDAIASDCGRYRYLLRRVWDFSKPRALLVMLNPSTADARQDDPTIRSCVRLLSALSYGSMEVVNVFGICATDPRYLSEYGDPFGPLNERVTASAVQRCDVAIAAWGAHQFAAKKTTFLTEWLRCQKPAIYCFGKTKGGAPKHPLYIKTGTPLEAF